MKKFAVALLMTVSASAFADQCQALSNQMAARAALLLQPGAELAELCQPCGQVIRNASVKVARSVRVVDHGHGYKEISINGNGVDLAYTYVKVAPNKYANVAKVIGCPGVSGVSPVISR